MWWVGHLAVPCCGVAPEFEPRARTASDGTLRCPSCGHSYEVEGGIVHFAEASGYAESFGLQWDRFAATQVDHLNGTTISADRLREICGGDLAGFAGGVTYDAGCGAGRYTAVVAAQGARVIAADLGLAAVRACRRNTGGIADVICVHADTRRQPVAAGGVDSALSVGVYQHTPRPRDYLLGVASSVRPGGRLVLWGYERRPRTLLHPHRLLRPLTKRLPPERLLEAVERSAPTLLRVSDLLRSLPGGGVLARAVPVANYRGVLPLTEEQIREWAVLDTFDWLSPTYDRPMTWRAVAATLADQGFAVTRTLEDSVGLVATRAR
jgi:SAM-dependent methyltransferase